jgi:hypothetical protein
MIKLSGFAQFCDDIRHEQGGKVTLVGLYQNDLVVEKFPALLPKFGISVTFSTKPKTVDFPLTIEFADQYKIVGRGTISIEQDDGLPTIMKDRRATSYIMLSPFELPCEGVLSVKADLNGKSEILGQIFVRQAHREKIKKDEKNKRKKNA